MKQPIESTRLLLELLATATRPDGVWLGMVDSRPLYLLKRAHGDARALRRARISEGLFAPFRDARGSRYARAIERVENDLELLAHFLEDGRVDDARATVANIHDSSSLALSPEVG